MGAAGTALAATDGSEPLIDPLSEESGVGSAGKTVTTVTAVGAGTRSMVVMIP